MTATHSDNGLPLPSIHKVSMDGSPTNKGFTQNHVVGARPGVHSVVAVLVALHVAVLLAPCVTDMQHSLHRCLLYSLVVFVLISASPPAIATGSNTPSNTPSSSIVDSPNRHYTEGVPRPISPATAADLAAAMPGSPISSPMYAPPRRNTSDGSNSNNSPMRRNTPVVVGSPMNTAGNAVIGGWEVVGCGKLHLLC